MYWLLKRSHRTHHLSVDGNIKEEWGVGLYYPDND